jgi:hypothetical protein
LTYTAVSSLYEFYFFWKFSGPQKVGDADEFELAFGFTELETDRRYRSLLIVE